MARRTQKTERFARYDSADYLKTPEDVAEYLVAAFEAGGDDAAYMAHFIGIAAGSAALLRAGSKLREA